MAPGRRRFERRPVSAKCATPPAARPKPGVCSHVARASGAPFPSSSTASVCATSGWDTLLTRQKFQDTRKETEIVSLPLFSVEYRARKGASSTHPAFHHKQAPGVT